MQWVRAAPMPTAVQLQQELDALTSKYATICTGLRSASDTHMQQWDVPQRAAAAALSAAAEFAVLTGDGLRCAAHCDSIGAMSRLASTHSVRCLLPPEVRLAVVHHMVSALQLPARLAGDPPRPPPSVATAAVALAIFERLCAKLKPTARTP